MMFDAALHDLKGFAGKTWLQLLALGVICICSFLVHPGAHDVDLMEARNFVTAREIVQSNNWLIPTLNREPRIAKPPLPTWITAGVRLAGGDLDNNALMRLPAGLAAAMMVFSLWGLMRELSKDRLLPFMVAAILATCVLIIDNGRRGTWDIYCHSFNLAAIWALAHAWQTAGRTPGAFVLAGLFMAFSFMSKGPVSFYGLLLPFLGAYLFTYGYRYVLVKWRGLCFSLGLLVLLSSLWPLYIYYAYPELAEMVAAAEVTAWADRHVQPFYFYLSFPIYTGLWVLFTITGFIKPYAQKHVDRYGRYGFVLLWIVLSLFLLSVIPEKKERYLIPAILPMAIMTGCLFRSLVGVFQEGVWRRGDGRLLKAQTVLTFFAALAAPVIMAVYGVPNGLISAMGAAAWAIPFLLVAGSAWVYGRQRKAGNIFLLGVILVCLVNLSMPPVIYRSPLFRNNPDYQSLRGVRDLKGVAGLNYYHLGSVNPMEVWDIGKPVTPVGDGGEEAFPLQDLPLILFSTGTRPWRCPTPLKNGLKFMCWAGSGTTRESPGKLNMWPGSVG